MNALTAAAASGDVEALASLVSRRLGGDILDAPYFGPLGATSRQIIIDLHSNTVNAPQLHRAILQILEGTAVQAIEDIQTNQNSALNIIWLREFLLLLAELQFDGETRQFTSLCLLIARCDSDKPGVLSLQVEAFRCFAVLRPTDTSDLAVIFSPALKSFASAEMFALAAAASAPDTFLQDLAPLLLTRLAAWNPDVESARFLSDVVRISVNALVSKNTHTDSQSLRTFLNHASTSAKFSCGPAIRKAVVDGLSKTNISASVIQLFERSYWDVHPKINIYSNPIFDRARLALGERVQSMEPTPPSLDKRTRTITMNALPYAEAAFFRIFDVMMNSGYSIDISRRDKNYANVVQDLMRGDIDMAAHNPSLARQYRNGTQLYQSNPLFRFRSYDVLASRRRLRQLVQDLSLSTGARQLASNILDGEQLGTEGHPVPQAELQELLLRGKVALKRRTDTEEAAQSFFGALSAPQVQDLDPDEGLERLLDGTVCFYVGGALQSHYAKRVCGNRVLEAGDVQVSTDVRFYVTQQRYDETPAVYDQCVRGWKVVMDFWQMLERPTSEAPADLRVLVDEMRMDLVLSINRDLGHRNGFMPSFDDLTDLIQKHDELLDPDNRDVLFLPVPAAHDIENVVVPFAVQKVA